MIMCPSCQHHEIEGALFCSECGAHLHALITQNIYTRSIKQEDYAPPTARSVERLATGAISLQIIDGGQLFSLADRAEFTLGRVSDGQSIMPDIDLSSYKGYECGVSRMHAVLKKRKGQVTITDLGSSNGTYVNGSRLKPEEECVIQHGNILSLGKLKIQLLLQK